MLAIATLVVLLVATIFAETASQNCDGDCSEEKRVLQIKATYMFAPYIHYNLENIECLLHQTFIEWFADYEFVNTFETCDIHLIYIRGGFENDTLCSIPPCIHSHSKHSGAIRRRLLPEMDGNTTMTLIPHTDEVASNIQAIAQNTMARAFETQFHDTFGVTITVQIAVELQHKIEPIAAYLIYVPVILVVLICCLVGVAIYYRYRRKSEARDHSESRNDSHKVARQPTSIDTTQTDGNRDTIDYERQSITSTEAFDANQLVERVNHPVPPQDPLGDPYNAVGSQFHPVGSQFNPVGSQFNPVGTHYNQPMPMGTQYNQQQVFNHVGTQPFGGTVVGSAFGPNHISPQLDSQAGSSQLGNIDSPFGGYYSTGSHEYKDTSALAANNALYPNYNNYNPNMPPLDENPHNPHLGGVPHSYNECNQYPAQNTFAMNDNQFPAHPPQHFQHFPPQKHGRHDYMVVDDSSSAAGSSMVSFPVSGRQKHGRYDSRQTVNSADTTVISSLPDTSDEVTTTGISTMRTTYVKD